MARSLIPVCCVLIIASCAKQKLETNTESLSRPWTIENYFEDGVHMTEYFDSVYTDYTLNFYETGNYTQTYLFNGTTPYNKTGTWQFLNGVKQIQLTDDIQTRIYDINELNENLFYFDHQDASILKQYEMTSN